MVGVYGPRQSERKVGYSEQGRISVDVKLATFATRQRGVFGQVGGSPQHSQGADEGMSAQQAAGSNASKSRSCTLVLMASVCECCADTRGAGAFCSAGHRPGGSHQPGLLPQGHSRHVSPCLHGNTGSAVPVLSPLLLLACPCANGAAAGCTVRLLHCGIADKRLRSYSHLQLRASAGGGRRPCLS